MKKMFKLTFGAVVLASALLLAGCGLQPIYNVHNQPVYSLIPAHQSSSMTKVQHAITSAAVGLGWKVNNVRPGLIEATLDLRSHIARVMIPYSKKSYSILYKSSVNLDHKGDKIHRHYNFWIRNLDAAIKKHLAGSSY